MKPILIKTVSSSPPYRLLATDNLFVHNQILVEQVQNKKDNQARVCKQPRLKSTTAGDSYMQTVVRDLKISVEKLVSTPSHFNRHYTFLRIKLY